MDLQLLYGEGSAVIVVGLVETLKRATGLPERFAPLASLIVGVAANFVIASAINTGPNTAQTIIYGIVAGLSAVGLYSGIRATAGK